MSNAPSAVAEPVEQTTEMGSAPIEQTNTEGIDAGIETSGKTEISNNEGSMPESEKPIPYSRFKDVNEKYKATTQELQAYKEKAELLDRLQSDPELARSVLKNFKPETVKEASPEVSRAMEVLREHGFITKDEMLSQLQEIQQTQQQEQMNSRIVESFKTQINELGKKYDGSDGGPAFDAEKVATFFDNNGIIWKDDGTPDAEAGYFLLNRDAIIDAQAKKVRSTSFSERGTSATAQPNDPSGIIGNAKKTGDFSSVFKTFLKK